MELITTMVLGDKSQDSSWPASLCKIHVVSYIALCRICVSSIGSTKAVECHKIDLRETVGLRRSIQQASCIREHRLRQKRVNGCNLDLKLITSRSIVHLLSKITGQGSPVLRKECAYGQAQKLITSRGTLVFCGTAVWKHRSRLPVRALRYELLSSSSVFPLIFCSPCAQKFCCVQTFRKWIIFVQRPLEKF